ncbi:hypothetical protein SAMN05444161_6811 [Rhizobiales bacterium GAS191]|nr:hypothetical protein SAMN05444161_6811 [Rhizobiales bacterium GAS191]
MPLLRVNRRGKRTPYRRRKGTPLGVGRDASIPPAELVGVAQRGGIDVQWGGAFGFRRGF